MNEQGNWEPLFEGRRAMRQQPNLLTRIQAQILSLQHLLGYENTVHYLEPQDIVEIKITIQVLEEMEDLLK